MACVSFLKHLLVSYIMAYFMLESALNSLFFRFLRGFMPEMQRWTNPIQHYIIQLLSKSALFQRLFGGIYWYRIGLKTSVSRYLTP